MTGISRLETNLWCMCPRPNPRASLRLFCFPYSGTGAQLFYSWPDALPPTIEVCPTQLPGRGNRLAEPPFTRLLPLVQVAAEALRPYLDKPFALFGHSLGALVSFELARHLRRRYGLSPVHLFVSAHCAPQIPHDDPPIHTLPEPEFLEKLCHLNGMSREILQNAELMELLLPILRADFAVCETYVYEADDPLDCPISAFGGLRDEYISHDDLEAWRQQTGASFSLHMFPGDHFYLHTDRLLLLHTLAQALSNSASTFPLDHHPVVDYAYPEPILRSVPNRARTAHPQA